MPSSSELSDQIEAVRVWLDELRRVTQVRTDWRTFTHWVLGESTLPDAVWLDAPHAACALIGKTPEVQRFAALLQTIDALDANLAAQINPWFSKRSLLALDLADAWPCLLAVLLDLCLPASAIDNGTTGLGGFCRRCGFWDKPLRIHLRVLDPALAVPGQDITLTQADFAQLNWGVQRVFITENEVNFLAIPRATGSVVVFGAGYGFDVLSGVAWLQRCTVVRWGDLDTYGFAILDQLRVHLSLAQSLPLAAQLAPGVRAHWLWLGQAGDQTMAWL